MDFQEDFSGNIGFIGFYCLLLVFARFFVSPIGFYLFPMLFDGFGRKLLVFLRFWLVFKENVDLSEVLC